MSTKTLLGFIVALSAILAGNAQTSTQPTIWASKPDVAAFEKIVNDHLAAAQADIDRITAVKGTRTIENTLAPFDEAVRQINSGAYLAGLMQQVHPDSNFRDRATEMVRKASALQTALSLNRDIYQALSSLDVSNADSATRYYVNRQLLEFRLAGVDKDDSTRAQLKKLSDDITEQQSMYDRNIADDQKKIEVKDPAELDGLPQDYIGRHKPGPDAKIYITMNYPDALPALKFSKSDDLRRRLFEAFQTRAYPTNKDVLQKMMKTRYQIAKLQGYSSWADYNAADKMIKTGGNIGEFIQNIDSAARPVAKREFAMLLAEKQKANPGAKEVADYEVSYLSELVRRSQFNFNSQAVRPYLPFNEVKKGILDTASTLFHVSFRPEENVPTWDASVETWDVFDGDKMVGRFYLDMHPRPGKFSHAEMVPGFDGIKGRQMPEAILVCNFPKHTAVDPGLMEYNDVVVFFHEFGHLMHWILGGHQEWAGISGITMEADFGEAPSQMLEEWMRSPQVLASFARHYKTGEAIPTELVERMNRASAFGRGTWVTQQNEYTAISYDVYKTKPEDVDPDAVTTADQKQYTLFTPIPGTHMYASFGHLGGYSSAYYTYLWDKVIAEDFFAQFDHANLLAGPVPMRYRRTVLEPGGSQSANDLVRNFLGREHNMNAFQKWMGEEFEASGKVAGGAN
jgi:thimet oligopeptidase